MANKKKNKKGEEEKKPETSTASTQLQVKCLICEEIIQIPDNNMGPLMEHIRQKHPELEKRASNRISTDHMEGEAVQNENKPTMEDITIRDEKTGKNLYTRRYRVNSNLPSESPRKRRLYRTSIEKWRPATGTIYCPKCGANKKPIIRSRSEKFSYNSCGAACILSCWPFCFLPFLFPMPPKEYLHCSNCQNFLGLYDREAETIRPNREFVEQEKCTEEQKPEMTEPNQQEVVEPEKNTGSIDKGRKSSIDKSAILKSLK